MSRPNQGLQKLLLILLALIFPPLPVIVLNNYCVWNLSTLLVVLFTLCGHFPGIIYAIWFILTKKQPRNGYQRLDDEQNVPTPVNGSEGHLSAPLNSSSADEPPTYEESRQGSTSTPTLATKSASDNKIQT